MKYSLSDYSAYKQGKGVRIDVYPNTEIAAKIVAMYEECAFSVVPVHQLISRDVNNIPSPKTIIKKMGQAIASCGKKAVFVGIDPYLSFLDKNEQKDFMIGLRSLMDADEGTARFMISNRFDMKSVFKNPRYKDSLQLVEFEGEDEIACPISIKLIRSEWCASDTVHMVTDALKTMGNYYVGKDYVFAMDRKYLPQTDYGCVSILSSPRKALSELYQISMDCSDDAAEHLLQECAEQSVDPHTLLFSHFGEEYLTAEKAPLRLNELVNDPLWDAYIWLLKSIIKPDTYFYRVLQHTSESADFLRNYIVGTPMAILGDPTVRKFAEERKTVLSGQVLFEPMITAFISETEEDDRAITFLNCGTNTERKAIIRHAKHLDLSYGLPEEYSRIDPVLSCYLSPKFNYGDPILTDYFHTLRCLRMTNTITREFVETANNVAIPSTVRSRDEVLQEQDDGDTALLIVDGMGAEYYPLLLNLAKQIGCKTENKAIVSAQLPSSTEFNPIKWDNRHMLQSVRNIDNVSHVGAAAHEKCSYDENLAFVFNTFQKDIFPRIVDGLHRYKRVVVTADHGSSYLAVLAHQNKYDKNLPWDAGAIDDWRYTTLDHQITTPAGMIASYSPSDSKWYYVVRGYNRLKHSGGKPYALHGGASLEEILVPMVVFTNDDIEETSADTTEEFIENDAFDVL